MEGLPNHEGEYCKSELEKRKAANGLEKEGKP